MIFSATAEANSDFSKDFLKGLLNQKTEHNFSPPAGSLEHDWSSHGGTDKDFEKSNDAKHYELYLKTEYELAGNRLSQADEVSEMLMDLNPPLPAHLARARLLFESGKFFELVQLPYFSEIEKAKDWETILMGARAYEMIGMLTKAEKLFDKAMVDHADKDQVVYHRVMHAIKRSNTDEASKIIDKFLKSSNPKARHSIFYQLKAAITMQADNPNLEQALKAINESLKLNPRSEKGLRMKLLIIEQMKKNKIHVDPTDLIETYKLACSITEDKTLKKALIDRLFKSGHYKQAYEELVHLEEKTAEHYFDLALLAFKGGNLEASLSHAEEALSEDKSFIKAQMLKLEILSEQKSDKTEKFALDWFKNKSNKSIARKALLHLLRMGTGSPEILKALEKDFQANKKNPEAIACLADAYMLQGNYEKALEFYEMLNSSLSIDFSNIALKASLIYSSAAAAYLAGRLELSREKLTNLSKSGKLPTEAYNLMAILKLHGHSLDDTKQALKFSKKAVKGSPTNPFFLSTLRFALLKAGKALQATRISFLLKIMDPMGITESSRFSWMKPKIEHGEERENYAPPRLAVPTPVV